MPKLRVLYAKKYIGLKKNTTAGCVVGTNISYDLGTCSNDNTLEKSVALSRGTDFAAFQGHSWTEEAVGVQMGQEAFAVCNQTAGTE